MRASQPLLVVLRIADGDEQPTMPKVSAAMENAKKIMQSLAHKPKLLAIVIDYVDKRWDSQMDQKLYGAALFLNPNKFFELRKDPANRRLCTKLRHMLNEVLWKMVPDEEQQSKISAQADDYERAEGECFTSKLAQADQKRKNPLLMLLLLVLRWGAYGGLAYELQYLTKCIVSLCCSAFGCELNWSTFEFIHTKKRNKLEHKRSNKLVYVAYKRKMTHRYGR